MTNVIQMLSPATFICEAKRMGVELYSVDGQFGGFRGAIAAAVDQLFPKYEAAIDQDPGFLSTVADLINGAARH